MAAVGSALVELEVEGAGNVKANGGPQPESAHKDVASPAPPVKPKKPQPATAKAMPIASEIEKPAFVTRTAGDKPLASPAVRQRARDLGIALQFVPGSGPAGRIGHQDLDQYVATGGQTARAGAPISAPRERVEQIKVIGLRRKIAQKMQESKRRIPHFAYVEEIDMTELEALRAHLNEGRTAEQPKLTVLPFIMRALVKALDHYPQINARFDDEADVVHRHAAVHIGIATQTANGLMVPVVRHAEARDIWENALEVSRVAALARDNKASKDDLTGSTITVTSLGALGGVATTPVINHPEVAIIGPNAIVERPVVRDGQIVVRKIMNLSSSFDHRVVDGYDAAAFVQKIKALLEHPATLFMA
jgi:2-oxoisovalerate dehydrogenase E2 component (dihydrolipoyl transacylase)